MRDESNLPVRRAPIDVEAMVIAAIVAVLCLVRVATAMSRLPEPIPPDATVALLVFVPSSMFLVRSTYVFSIGGSRE